MHITYTCSYKAVLYIRKLLTISFSVNHLQSYRGHNQNLTPLAIWTSGAVTRFLLGQYHSREQDTLKEWGLRQFLGSSRRGGTEASWVLSRALGQKIRNISNWWKTMWQGMWESITFLALNVVVPFLRCSSISSPFLKRESHQRGTNS